MLFLVTDTSGKQGFVALVRANAASENNVELIESVPLEGGTFSAQLVPQIAGLLAKHGFAKSGVDAFVVASGPGSFTGLRVGLAAVKALAEILHKPIVPVSLLEVLAIASGREGKVLAAMDAGRGEVYEGEYEVNGDDCRRLAEQLLPKDEFVAQARGAQVATSDAALAKITDASGAISLDAMMLAQVGWRKLHAGETATPEQLEANYIRRSDAEIFAEPKL
jgi:tRNA threonylcarbamoyladenosine biosynthesis protein TsaB